MKSSPQNQTVAAAFRAEIEGWRTANRMSRESVAIAIVEAHEQTGFDAATEIDFEFSGSDAYDRAKKSAQKIFRWLDEGNLPANMLTSILAALPLDLRLHCLNAILRPIGIEAKSAEAVDVAGFDAAADLKAMMKEATEAQLALVGLNPHSSVEELKKALREVEESQEADAQTARHLKAAIAAREAGSRQLRSVN